VHARRWPTCLPSMSAALQS